MSACVLMVAASVLAAAPPAPNPDFLTAVGADFDRWDADRDGSLSADEVERAVHDPAVKGPAAAAAAALRRAVRADRTLAPLTLTRIRDAVPYRANATPKPPRYEALYAAALERIHTARRELFVADPPNADAIHQGHLGDCFLLASLGTVAHADPARLRTMFRPLPGGRVEVALGTGRVLAIDMPTDAEICIGATNGNDGMWAVAFEKAMGTVLLERQAGDRHATPLSRIGVGGTPNTVLSLVTGHTCERVGCEDFQRGTLAAAGRDRRLAEVRAKLLAAKKAGRLVVGGTAPLGGKQTVVPGLYYNHSYGVLGYDEKADTVTFWNPFGNRYTPKGPAGLSHGYPTEHGRFTVPLADAVMWFGSFSVETDTPVPATPR